MIDTRTFESYKFDLEQSVRDYTQAANDIKQIKETAISRIKESGTSGLETKEILDEMFIVVFDREATMRWAQDEFNKTKDKMIAMISNINMPSSY